MNDMWNRGGESGGYSTKFYTVYKVFFELLFIYCKHTKRVLTEHIPTLHTKTTYKAYNTATYANYNICTAYAKDNAF